MPNFPTPTLTFIATTNAMLTLIPVGYQMTVLNNPQKIMEQFVNESYTYRYGKTLTSSSLSFLWSFIVSCLAIGGLSGCFLSVPLRENLGLRKALILYNNLFLVIGCLFFALAKRLYSFECLIIGRLTMGIFTGCGMALVTALIQECSPPEFRGMLSCLVHIGVTFGASLAPVLGMDLILGGEFTWPYLMTLPVIFAAMQLCIYPMTLESPMYLHERAPNCDAAVAAIRYYYGPEFSPRDVLAQFDAERLNKGSQAGLMEVFNDSDTKIRSNLLLAALVNFSSVFTGVMALISYSTVTLEALGLPMEQSQEATATGGLLGGLLAVFFTIPTLLCIEKTGRRKIFIPTMLILSMVDFALVILGTMIEMNKGGAVVQLLFLISLMLFMIAYNIGPGPIQYFISGELAPDNYRTVFLAVGVSANMFAIILSTLLFYPVNSLFGSRSFLIFALPSLFSALLFWWKLPETKTSTQEILERQYSH